MACDLNLYIIHMSQFQHIEIVDMYEKDKQLLLEKQISRRERIMMMKIHLLTSQLWNEISLKLMEKQDKLIDEMNDNFENYERQHIQNKVQIVTEASLK